MRNHLTLPVPCRILLALTALLLSPAVWSMPSTPTIVEPQSQAIVTQTPIEFVWQDTGTASSYDFYTKSIAERTNGLVATDICDATDLCRYVPATSVSEGSNHVWRVRSRNNEGTSPWSYTSFDLQLTLPPTAPVPLAPSTGAVLSANDPITFQWSHSEAASHYELLVYDRVTRSTIFRENTLLPASLCTDTTCNFTPTLTLSAGTNHVWRIRSRNARGSSSWTYTAFNYLSPAPDVPTALTPAADQTYPAGTSISYSWTQEPGASHYELILYDRGTATVVFRDNNLTTANVCSGAGTCSLTPDIQLSIANNHVWRIRAHGTGGSSSLTYTSFDISPTTVDPKVVETPDLDDYQLVFSDEFSGSVLDANKWRTTHLWGPYLATNNEEQIYIDILDWHQGFAVNPIEVADGNLTIRAIDNRDHSIPGPVQPEESDPIWNSYPEYNYREEYNSGIVTSYDSFRFTSGYIEARAKVPPGRGLWSAFWLLSGFYVEDIPEIDIMEALGQFPDTIYHTYHYFDTSDGWKQFSTPTLESKSADFTDDFHVYAASWDHEYIIWYIDGEEKHRISAQEYPIATQSMYVLANLAVGGNWPGSPDNSTQFPAEFVLDYIRVYQKTPPTTITPAVLDNEFELVFADEFNGNSLDQSKWNTAYLWGPYLQINNEHQVYPDVHGMHQSYPVNPFTLEDGILSIHAEPVATNDLPEFPEEDDAIWSEYPSYRNETNYGTEWVPTYTSGLITSYDAFKFISGYVEISARLPQGDGAWPALWLLNGYYVGNLPEIDIVELNGAFPDAAHQTYHYSDSNGNVISSPEIVDGGLGPDGYTSDFHTYGLHWSPGRIDWYIDGVKTRTLENDNVSNQLMYVIANFAIGGNFVGEVDPADYPATMDIDYIHVYRLKSE